MATQRVRRVPDEILRRVLERLNRSGELPVLLAHLDDECDRMDEEIRGMLSGRIITDAKELAAIQAYQGALSQIGRIRDGWRTIAERKAPVESNGNGLETRQGDRSTAKRDRVPL